MDLDGGRDEKAGMVNVQSLANQRRGALITLFGVLAGVVFHLAGPNLPRPVGDKLRIVGSRSMAAPVEQWASMFQRRYPHVRVSAALFGTGLAAGAIADQRADVAPLSRPLDRQELAMIDDAPEPVAIRVGNRAAVGEITPQWVYIYVVRDRDGRVEPVAEAFARVALSREGQARINGSDFRALSPAQREASLDQVALLSSPVQ